MHTCIDAHLYRLHTYLYSHLPSPLTPQVSGAELLAIVFDVGAYFALRTAELGVELPYYAQVSSHRLFMGCVEIGWVEPVGGYGSRGPSAPNHT